MMRPSPTATPTPSLRATPRGVRRHGDRRVQPQRGAPAHDDRARRQHGGRAGAGPVTAQLAAPAGVRGLADAFVAYLETGRTAPGLFAPGVFVDFTMPTWRLQAAG